MATVFVALPLVIREVVPVLEEIGDDQEQAARSLGANAPRLPAGHPARASSGRSSTAWSSAWPARSASSAPSRSSRATSWARPRRPPSWWSRSTRTSAAGRTRPRSCSLARVACIVIVSLLRPKENKRPDVRPSIRKGPHEHRRPGRHQEVRGLRRPRRRQRLDPDRPADRPARAQRRRQVHPAADHRRAGDRPTPARSPSRASTPRTCRRRSATSASSSSTTPSSST